ncbi:carboxyl transferase domain-containing protein [Sneathiella chinensis]|uniref:Pyruvate carboxylase n=1 Tax=Sneathiella chinensis TaxID=349750 RepID=A0ABQ5U4C5_9PROT|nr:carboxyl transferase domain-containing protein [Sneathiella chinensis]GLQ06093.1 pyruvate carboxylase [Sneathiella chinensis]
MSIRCLAIANRGEISLRIIRSARLLGIEAVALHSEDDAGALFVRRADRAVVLPGTGPAAYLDIPAVVEAIKQAGADAVHPGYGFLSENPQFAEACREAGITFVGPTPETLQQLADKSAARRLAMDMGVPCLGGTNDPTSLERVEAFMADLPAGEALFIKAVSGGGGRGMRLVHKGDDLAAAFKSAEAEAMAAFGDGRLYVERFMPSARHVEVQVIGDGQQVCHLFDRDCSLQRRHQKIVEIAPAGDVAPEVREQLFDAALRMAAALSYRGVGTFEFLVSNVDGTFAFMEANPRLQVEHTVTEEILGLDLVSLQLEIAGGKSLVDLGVVQSALQPDGVAIQARINAEVISETGEVRPAGGALTGHEVPTGKGIRVDGCAHGGWQPNPRYDSLVSKVIVHTAYGGQQAALHLLDRALGEYVIAGTETSIPFVRAVLQHEDVLQGKLYTRFVDDHVAALFAASQQVRKTQEGLAPTGQQGQTQSHLQAPPGTRPIESHLMGTVVELSLQQTDTVGSGQVVAILEAMKMEHQIIASFSGQVAGVAVSVGETVAEGQPLFFVEPADIDRAHDTIEETVDLDAVRPDLAALLEKQGAVLDAARPEAVAKRHAKGKRTIRENIARLVDDGSFSEYGSLNIAAQRSRHSVETLEKISPADGMVAGTASLNGQHFDESRAACVVLGYDYTVFAGTQGVMNHKKTDRMLHLAEARQLPVIFYGEGGGGRPGDVDLNAASTLDVPTFQTYARLSGLVPRIAIASGRCFAGNAALMGVSDILIATEDTTIGMGGPAMIEGGGLGVFTPDEVGPVSVQGPNGVVDLVVPDEEAATDAARTVLSYFQGEVKDWTQEDQRKLRFAIPENRLRVYDIRAVIDLIADTGSVTELRPDFAPGMLTCFIRIEGRPLGLIANNPQHLGGAIDADGSEKAARHIQLCDAFDIPILSLCDTPGFMVGPEAEKTALVRKTARLFAAAGSVTVPFMTVILRKAYGLGAQAMAGGSTHAPFLTISWPTGEMGPMGLEGAVRLGFRKELEAIADEGERQAAFDQMVAAAYVRGKAVNAAAFMEIDDVIDPLETRTRLVMALKAAGNGARIRGKKRTFVDSW